MAHRKHLRRPEPAAAQTVPTAQTKSTKAMVAALITLAGLVGLHLTDGTAQLVVAVLQLAAVFYGVWRTRNAPKRTTGPGVGDFL